MYQYVKYLYGACAQNGIPFCYPKPLISSVPTGNIIIINTSTIIEIPLQFSLNPKFSL